MVVVYVLLLKKGGLLDCTHPKLYPVYEYGLVTHIYTQPKRYAHPITVHISVDSISMVH